MRLLRIRPEDDAQLPKLKKKKKKKPRNLSEAFVFTTCVIYDEVLQPGLAG
jgi:hypothetical protein